MFQARPVFTVLVALLSATTFAAPTLRPASHVQFPHATDSNSPGHWDGPTFYLFNSTGHPYRSYGSNIFQLGNTAAVTFNNTVNGGRWMEATWRAIQRHALRLVSQRTGRPLSEQRSDRAEDRGGQFHQQWGELDRFGHHP